jgi:hypothetical protein
MLQSAHATRHKTPASYGCPGFQPWIVTVIRAADLINLKVVAVTHEPQLLIADASSEIHLTVRRRDTIRGEVVDDVLSHLEIL